MAYMCADSGNLMAIAQQVIQQKQKQEQQQQQMTSMPPPPWGVDPLPFTLPDPFDPLPFSDFGPEPEFDSDDWMDTLFADPPDPPLPQPHLLRSLLDCARLSESDPDLALQSLARIKPSASDLGDPAQRVAFYFARALDQRLTGRHVDCPPDDVALCYKAMNDACPYFKFAHLTANQAILESTESSDRIHVIDFGIDRGVQWAALLQALATRAAGKPSLVRISGVPSPSLAGAVSALESTGKRLREFASALDLEFEFDPILTPIEELTLSGFRVGSDESVAVNFMLQLHGLELDSVQGLVGLAKSMGPSVVTLCEYELGPSQTGYSGRFAAALHHFSSVFESVESGLGRDSMERTWVERSLFGRGILDAVGSENRRLWMEGREGWRAVMERCGFESVPVSNYAVSQAKLLLLDYKYSPKYSLLDGISWFLSLQWSGNSIITVSSWR